MAQSYVTVAIAFPAANRDAVNDLLRTLGDPAGAPGSRAADARRKLDSTTLIHFMSITALPAAENEPMTHLVIEASADEGGLPFFEMLSEALCDELEELLGKAGVERRGAALAAFLASHRIKVGQGWFSTPGLNFSGTPGMSVQRILRERELAERIAPLLETRRAGSALRTLERVRAVLWDDAAAKWAFVPEPAPILDAKPSPLSVLLPALGSAIKTLLWPFLLLAVLPLVAYVATLWPGSVGTALWAFVGILVAEMLAGIAVYRGLRARELADIPDDIAPAKADVDAAMRQESYALQNHLAAQSRMKPGRLRRATLHFGLWAAGLIGSYFSAPGFLGPTGVIHFARWLLLPGTDKLLFMSNYDGAWESYLENFIQEAHQGVTGIWSNTRGFPKTSNLFSDGASDGNRLRRWTRRQQHPTLFWYSAYPRLTLPRIRLNAAIRQGLAAAATEAAAADWLACFGSAPRPADELEIDSIPTLAFGGLRRLRHGKCLLLRFPDDAARCREWLRRIEPQLSYGDHRAAEGALLVAYSRSGLAKLGLAHSAIATFPVAFQDGMFAPWRVRALGDAGVNSPENWCWGGPTNEIDAIMLVYSRDWAVLARSTGERREEAAQFGIDIVGEVAFKETPSTGPVREPFGFIDGISQPVLRGAGRWTAAKYRDQVVEPGEIVLGYRDGSGYLPASPTVPSSEDPEKLLPEWDPSPPVQRPDFAVPEPTGERDLGCNGTFLVVRQLEQDAAAFDAFLEETGRGLGKPPGSGSLSASGVAAKEWVAAKMVGRWRKDGTSLVRHPESPGSGDLAPIGADASDNAFRFAAEDATGRRCPFGAHIRRANPRDSFAADPKTALAIANRHRILRVGRSYEKEGENPGLLFMCLNADIERQFEFVQQTWLLGPSFQGLEDEIDPIVGGSRRPALFTVPTPEGPLRICGLKDFVTVKGGGYFFLPGRSAVRFLAR